MAGAVVLALFALTIWVFATERMPMEVYSLLLIVVLVATRILTPEQAFGGFGNSAVVMIAGVMLMSGALLRNGAVDVLVAQLISAHATSERRMVAGLLGSVNVVSAFINNVAATALFVPVAEGVARRLHTDPAKYLMPVAFASMTGGVCTLIGTSTNIAVSRAMTDYGLAPLGLFELTPLGVAIALAGTVYLLLGGARRLQSRPRGGEALAGEIKEFLFEIQVLSDGTLTGRTLEEAALADGHGVTVLAIVRQEGRLDLPGAAERIHGGDLLLVRSTAERIGRLRHHPGVAVKSMPKEHHRALLSGDAALVEATVSHNSPLVGKTLREWGFRQRYELTVIAVHRREELLAEKVGYVRLRPGDVLLLFGSEERIERLLHEGGTLLIESTVVARYNGPKALLSSGLFLLAVIAGATGSIDIPTAFLGGGALIVAAGCLPPSELAAHVNLRFLIMIAAMVALGSAMEQSGAAELLARGVAALPGSSHPSLLLGTFFVMTVALTQPLNNAAAALLVLPIAIHAAEVADLSPRPLVVIVTVAASCSFLTPFEPANLLVYGKGHYRFSDFWRIGGMLTLLVGLLCIVIVPWLWPGR